ncbi:MAG: GNAT family N-acetyltransferase [Ginsengibacter sp.]
MNNGVTISNVNTDKSLKRFIHFPYLLNKNNSNWVPPLLLTQKLLFNTNYLFWERNPYQFLLAYKNEKCVGRLAAFVNLSHNSFHNSRQGCFGFLEAENDVEIFKGLLNAAENFATQNNCNEITGPLNPDLHNELGVLTDGFETPPYFMLTHNYNYYDEQIKRCGYQKLKDFYSYKLDASQYVPTEKMKRVVSFLQSRHKIKIRNAAMKFFNKELDILYTIYNDAFIGHWGFTPIQKDEFTLLAKDMKRVIDPRLVLIAEMNKEPIAFLLCIPNFNEVFIKIKNGKLFPTGIFKFLSGKKKIKSARVITVAVRKKYQYLGVGALLYKEIMKTALQLNYHESELSWVVEDNFMMNKVAQDLTANPYKTYRLYSKHF